MDQIGINVFYLHNIPCNLSAFHMSVISLSAVPCIHVKDCIMQKLLHRCINSIERYSSLLFGIKIFNGTM